MKAIKWISIVIIIVAIAIGGLVYVGLSNLNAIVKAVTEEVGSTVTGTQVRLDRANIVLTEGRGELLGLGIANPPGFSRDNIFELGRIVVDIDHTSLGGDVIVLQEVVISDMSILAEQKNLVETNIQALLDNLSQGADSASSSSSDQPSTAGQEVLLAVEKFVFEKSEIEFVTEKWGNLTLPLPAVELNNLGSAQRGLTPNQLAEQALSPVVEQVKDQLGRAVEVRAKQEVVDRAEEKLKEKLDKELSGSEKEALNKVKSLFK